MQVLFIKHLINISHNSNKSLISCNKIAGAKFYIFSEQGNKENNSYFHPKNFGNKIIVNKNEINKYAVRYSATVIFTYIQIICIYR